MRPRVGFPGGPGPKALSQGVRRGGERAGPDFALLLPQDRFSSPHSNPICRCNGSPMGPSAQGSSITAELARNADPYPPLPNQRPGPLCFNKPSG